jgi:hypothetical protein
MSKSAKCQQVLPARLALTVRFTTVSTSSTNWRKVAQHLQLIYRLEERGVHELVNTPLTSKSRTV